MSLEIEKLNDFKIHNDDIVRVTKTGDITRILALARKNSICPITKLNKDEYVLNSTGEILQSKHIQNRSQNMNTIRFSVSQLRDLINNNFFGGSNELWVTLTFGQNKIYDPKKLYSIFSAFIKRLKRCFKSQDFDYIYVPEPHLKGDWHIHVLLKSNKKLFIKNSVLQTLWGQGFVKVNRLKDIDNIGAYVSAYLINIKDGELTKKGARLYLYPPHHRLFRYSSGIVKPVSYYCSYADAKKIVSSDKLTFCKAIKITTDDGFSNTICNEFYNKNRK